MHINGVIMLMLTKGVIMLNVWYKRVCFALSKLNVINFAWSCCVL